MNKNHNKDFDDSILDIRYKEIYKFLKRNIFLLSGISFIFLIITLITQLKKDEFTGTIIYQGNLKIYNPKLMENQKKFDLLQKDLTYFNKEDIKITSNMQRIILQSQNFLQPIYEYYREIKTKDNNISKISSYQYWRSNFKFDFSNNGIISITFEDHEKEVINKTINKFKNSIDLYTRNLISNELKNANLLLSLKKEINKQISKESKKQIRAEKIIWDKIENENLQSLYNWEILSGPDYTFTKNDEKIKLSKLLRIYFFTYALIILILYLKELNSGIIYDKNIIKNKIYCNSLIDIYLNNGKIDLTLFKNIIFNNPPNKKDIKIGLIFADSFFAANKSKLFNLIFPLNENTYGLDISDEKLINNLDFIYVCSYPGTVTLDQLKILNSYLYAYRNKVIGLISILPKD